MHEASLASVTEAVFLATFACTTIVVVSAGFAIGIVYLSVWFGNAVEKLAAAMIAFGKAHADKARLRPVPSMSSPTKAVTSAIDPVGVSTS